MPIKIYFRKHCQYSILVSIFVYLDIWNRIKSCNMAESTPQTLGFISLFTLKSKSVFVLSNNYFFRKQLFCFVRSISPLRRNTHVLPPEVTFHGTLTGIHMCSLGWKQAPVEVCRPSESGKTWRKKDRKLRKSETKWRRKRIKKK